MEVSMSKTQGKIFLVAGTVALLLTITTLYVSVLSPRSTTTMAANTPAIQPYTAEDAMSDYVKRLYPNTRLNAVDCDAKVDDDGFAMCRSEGINNSDYQAEVFGAMFKNIGTPTDICN
jgi:hypothetical protein